MRERRTAGLVASIERREQGDPVLQFNGHAAVFNQRTWIGPKRWGFWEEIDPGFFREVLQDDAAFLVNHDPNIVLARNPNTMSLSTDDVGLVVDADWDSEDDEARRWAGRVKRGDVGKMSFAFEVAEDKWAEEEDGSEVRTLLLAKRLWDTSLVTYPAYEGTDAGMRDAAAVVKRHRGFDPLTESEPARPRGVPGRLRARHRMTARRYGLPL